MNGFTFSTVKLVLFESNGASKIGQLCGQFSAQSVFIVTDKGILNNKLLDTAINSLTQARVKYTIFSAVEADPSEQIVVEAVEQAKQINADLILGFGGGSPMDVAKLVAVLSHPNCSQAIQQCYGVDSIEGDRLPLILAPTTAGTGSEVTPVSIITTGGTTKAGVVSSVIQPDVALLDPSLTLGLPAAATAATGIDAMVHAIEAYTSKIKKNCMSDMFAMQAIALIADNIHRAVHQPQDLEARGNMLLGASLAGQAFANAPVAAVHALAYPLGGHFHIPHGLSNSLVLPHVLRFNASHCEEFYADIGRLVIPSLKENFTDKQVTEQFITWVEELISSLGLPIQLRECGVESQHLEMLSKEAMLQTRLLVNNPREMTEQLALEIYQQAY